MHAENFCIAKVMKFGAFFLSYEIELRLHRDIKCRKKEFFLACVPQGNVHCQGKSINSHAKKIRSIILGCCAQFRKCPIYSDSRFLFSSLALLTCTVHDMEVIQEKLHMLTIQQIQFICLWDDSLPYSWVQSLCHNPSDFYIVGLFVTC